MARRSQHPRCSFCGKAKDEVGKLIAGPGVFICDQCVELCTEILNEEPPASPPRPPKGRWTWSLRRQPKGFFAFLGYRR